MPTFEKAVLDVSPAVKTLMTDAGYKPTPTGGGCMAWEKVVGDYRIWICTGGNELDGDLAIADWLVGLYSPDGDWLNSHEAYTLADALQIATTLPRDVSAWAEWIQQHPTWYRN